MEFGAEGLGTKVESGTSQSKSGSSIHLSNSGLPVGARREREGQVSLARNGREDPEEPRGPVAPPHVERQHLVQGVGFQGSGILGQRSRFRNSRTAFKIQKSWHSVQGPGITGPKEPRGPVAPPHVERQPLLSCFGFQGSGISRKAFKVQEF